MKSLRLILILFILPGLLPAQMLSGDSLLANERAIDRPVTLHGGQFRITGAYGLSILSRRYDLHGASIPLEHGLSSSRHRFLLDVKYGVNDYVQFNVAMAYIGNIVRDKTDYILPIGPDPVVSHDVTTKYSGLEDLFLGLDLRAPLRTRKLDLAMTLAATLPVAPFQPPKPDHSFENRQTSGGAMHKFVYRYDYPPGKGITLGRLGAMIKYRMTRLAFSGRIDYQHGLNDGKSFEWRHQLNADGTFEYRRDHFTYRLPDSFLYFAEIEYQPRPRLDIFLNLSGHTAYRGWISPEENLKVAIPYQNSWLVSPGFEIIITPELWIRERINFSLAGRSYEAPFSFETSLIYNFFPFE